MLCSQRTVGQPQANQQEEPRQLADTKIETLSDVVSAISTLHKTYRVPHIIITSARLGPFHPDKLCIVGSSARSDHTPRIFTIEYPVIDCFFNGTGDMFAALTVVRLREAVAASAGLSSVKGWVSPDHVEAVELPLARAAEKVMASMQEVLRKTQTAREEELQGLAGILETESGSEKRMHLRKTKAAEIRLVRNLDDLRTAEVRYRAEAVET